MRLAATLAAGALALAACGGGESDTGGGSTGGAKSDVKVGLAYDIGGRGDKSFNDAAAAGLDKAKADLGVEVKDLAANAGETDADKVSRLKLLAEGGFNPVIAVGFAYSKAVAEVAPDYPKVSFAIIDDAAAKAPNIANLIFAEEQGSFLVGVAAALKSTTGKVGYIGGVQTPLLEKFQAGFEAGAKAAKPGITVQSRYLTQPPDFSGFGDPAKGRTAAEGQYDAGVDVIYAAAGGSGTGVFAAAKAKGKLAIGVDSDQYQTADAAVKDVIITSMLKRVDVAVFDFIQTVVDGKPATGEVVYDLKKDGVGYATSGGKVDDIKTKLDDYKQQIIDGKITVPSKPAAG